MKLRLEKTLHQKSKHFKFRQFTDTQKIQLKNNYDPFSEPQTEEHFINKMPYEKIVISGKGYVSTEAISLLNQNNIIVILIDTYDNPPVLYNPQMISFVTLERLFHI